VPAHRAVFTAIQAGDPGAARTAMTAIIGEVMEFITTAKVKQ
jgi:DNA-binding FadR family transcriptional regulator